ncbi:MAG: SOS response-associated peptidase [Armatimonadetes bacterium]|nr:MAG: SOS response-associated peptidase [Armatimonadota bacterium]
MCGRFVQVEKPEFYAEHFQTDFVRTETITPSWNVAPTMDVYAVAQHDGDRVLTSFRWGLVPFWAKDRKIGSRAINARVETAADKPMFRDSFATRRCLIPLDGFYEWERKAKGKLPHYIHNKDGSPLAAAGLWASWRDKETDERLLTCTILTGKPNELLEPIHDRMPVIIDEEHWDPWLDPQTGADAVQGLVRVYPASRLVEYPVSTLVNNVRNDTADNLTPLETAAVDSE